MAHHGTPVPSSRDSNGHNTVILTGPDGWPHVRRIDEMVLEAFIGPRKTGQVPEHINGDPGDDRAVNLRWTTP